MDDILFINNPTAQQYIYQNKENPHGIYPQKFFILTTDNPPSTNVHYLDMDIHIIDTPKNLKQTNKLYNYPLQHLRNLAKRHKVSSRDSKLILIEKLLNKFNNQKTKSFSTNKNKIWNTKNI
jgi:hypothetical protein